MRRAAFAAVALLACAAAPFAMGADARQARLPARDLLATPTNPVPLYTVQNPLPLPVLELPGQGYAQRSDSADANAEGLKTRIRALLAASAKASPAPAAKGSLSPSPAPKGSPAPATASKAQGSKSGTHGLLAASAKASPAPAAKGSLSPSPAPKGSPAPATASQAQGSKSGTRGLLAASAKASPAPAAKGSPSPSPSPSPAPKGSPAPAADYTALQGIKVQRAADGDFVELLSLWQAMPGQRVVVPFLTHFGDLTSWEFAQRLQKKALVPLVDAGVKVITVGLGAPENARAFAAALNYPTDALFADPTGACYKALAFNPGFADSVEGVDPYLKLLPMLAGIGSPGTLQEVIRGYIGDRSAEPVFDGPLGQAFNILGQGYQRPMELATLRLQNMVGVLSKWGELAPADKKLLIQQGGCVVFDGCDVLYKHSDPGILKYADVDAVVAAATQAPQKLIAKYSQ